MLVEVITLLLVCLLALQISQVVKTFLEHMVSVLGLFVIFVLVSFCATCMPHPRKWPCGWIFGVIMTLLIVARIDIVSLSEYLDVYPTTSHHNDDPTKQRLGTYHGLSCLDNSDNNQRCSKNILIVAPALRGHATPLVRIAKELLDRGYNVAFATHSHAMDWIPSNAAFISLGQFPLTSSELRKHLQKVSRDPSTFHGVRSLFNDIYLPSSQTMYQTLMPVIKELQPLVIVSDIAALGALDAAAQSGVPLVINNPTFPFSLESPPPWLPAWGTGLSIHMSLWEKCMNLFFPRLLSVALTPPFITLNKNRWSVDLPTYRSQHEIFREARILVNTAFGFDYSRRMPPLNSLVGVILPKVIKKSNVNDQLNLSLLGYQVQKNNVFQGVIVVCLGRMAQMEQWQAAELTQGLNDPRFNVIWIVPKGQKNLLPKKMPPGFSVQSAKSMGEQRLQLFANPSVRAVITAGGLQSVQEALYFGKPVIVIPFLADQVDVAARVVDQGVGITLSKIDFSAEEVKQGVLDLFGKIQPIVGHHGRTTFNLSPANSTFAENARRVGAMLNLSGGLDRAANIIESSIVSSNTHLRTYSLEQPWHRVFQVDIFVMYSAVCALAVVMFHCINLLIEYFWQRKFGKIDILIIFSFPCAFAALVVAFRRYVAQFE